MGARMSSLTVAEYVWDMRSFCSYCAARDIPLAQAAEADAVAWMSKGKRGLTSSNTQTRKLSALRRFFTFLLLEGRVSKNFAMEVAHPGRSSPPPKTILSKDVIRNLLKALPTTLVGQRDRAVIYCIYEGMLEVNELVNLRLSDVDLETGVLTVNGLHRTILSADARNAVQLFISDVRPCWIRGQTVSILFLGDKGEAPLTRQGIWGRLSRYSALVDQPISPRTLRDASIAHAAEEG
jgi:integrase/recombinase XerD